MACATRCCWGPPGPGKTFTAAKVIEAAQRPTLVMAHNKTLAAQLYQEFREFFPENAVEYFVSYYDYFQPEAYLPRSDTYIEKDSSRNDEIDRLRHNATRALFERRDVVIVASVSCIYGLGAPIDYGATVINLKVGGHYRRDGVLRHLVDLQYQRNDAAPPAVAVPGPGRRARGPAAARRGGRPDRLLRGPGGADRGGRRPDRRGPRRAEGGELLPGHPLRHAAGQAAGRDHDIEAEMEIRVRRAREPGRAARGRRLEQRTLFDLEMLREVGFCPGIENYSRHLRGGGRQPAVDPDRLLPDRLPAHRRRGHITIPQVHGMYKNDRTRKEVLVEFGFRLESALDNRPLTFDEWEAHLNQVVSMSATPGPYETRAGRTGGRAVHPADRGRGSGHHHPPTAARSTTCWPRSATPSPAASGPWSRPSPRRWPRTWPTTSPSWGSRSNGSTARWTPSSGSRSCATSARRLRRAGRDQPPPRGARPARGDPGRDPRRRQGRVPAERRVAHPGHRPGGPERRWPGDHVRR